MKVTLRACTLALMAGRRRGILALCGTSAVLAVGFSLATSSPVLADSLYTDRGNLVGDPVGDGKSAVAPGTEITVLVTENIQANLNATTQTSKDSKVGASWDFGTLLPGTAKSSIALAGNDSFAGAGTTKRNGQITLAIAARITEVLPDGSLRIEGSKSLRVNDEDETVTLSGIVRAYDIDPFNQVQSSRIADMKLDYKGTGPDSAKVTPGIMTRVLNWLF